MARKKDIFNNFIKLNRGFDLPEKDIISGEFPVVASTAIKAYHHNYKVEPPCVVTGRSGSLGKVQYVTSRCWPLNTTLYVKDYKGNLPRYAYYFLETMRLENFNSGAGVPTLNQNHLHKLRITIPSLPEQKKIAAILAAYDDLIGNNSRRIAILEKMAEELYREWFVRLRFPGHEKVKIVKGVPEEWKLRNIGELVEFHIGGGWGEENSTLNYPIGAYVIRGTDIPSLNSGDFVKEIFRYHKESNYVSRKLFEGDIIFEVAGGSKDQLLGRTLLVTEDLLRFFENKVICASFCKLIRVNREVCSPFFLKYFFKSYYESGLVGTYQIQSTGISNYQFEDMLKYQKALVPNKPLLDKFDSQVKVIIQTKDKISLVNEKLRFTRDRLLSRLMSGKIDVENMDIEFPASMQEELAHA